MTRRPARYEDLVEGAKIVVLDERGKESISVFGLGSDGDAWGKHDGEDIFFTRSDFEDDRHGDYGLKLYVDEPEPVDLTTLGLLLRVRVSTAWTSIEADLQASIIAAIKERL